MRQWPESCRFVPHSFTPSSSVVCSITMSLDLPHISLIFPQFQTLIPFLMIAFPSSSMFSGSSSGRLKITTRFQVWRRRLGILFFQESKEGFPEVGCSVDAVSDRCGRLSGFRDVTGLTTTRSEKGFSGNGVILSGFV
ncbi:hypothetical protein Droror1_Dr00010567 [Drosera rotundifolia]